MEKRPNWYTVAGIEKKDLAYGYLNDWFDGVSRREVIAISMAKALIQRDHAITAENCARKACVFADELIKALNSED